MGYSRAGFDVVGVDIERQKAYPFEFHQVDAFEFIVDHWQEFDAVHASPPCQAYIPRGVHMKRRDGVEAPMLIDAMREALEHTGLPYVMENVPSAPLADLPLFGTPVVKLCGTMFGLQTPCGAQLQRHRLFELNWDCPMPPACNHVGVVVGVYGDHIRDRRRVISVAGHDFHDPAQRSRDRRAVISVTGSVAQQNVRRNQERKCFSVEDARIAMGIDWMSMKDLSQAIPPAYTEWIGRHLINHLIFK